VNEISVASGEQSTGVEQINQGLTQISQVVQTNAATSEEAAAASEELSSQAAQLKEIVSFFKVKQQSLTSAHRAEQPSASVKKTAPALDAHQTQRKNIALGDDFGKY
jgi:methyl-accepting chemotaxis protein